MFQILVLIPKFLEPCQPNRKILLTTKTLFCTYDQVCFWDYNLEVGGSSPGARNNHPSFCWSIPQSVKSQTACLTLRETGLLLKGNQIPSNDQRTCPLSMNSLGDCLFKKDMMGHTLPFFAVKSLTMADTERFAWEGRGNSTTKDLWFCTMGGLFHYFCNNDQIISRIRDGFLLTTTVYIFHV